MTEEEAKAAGYEVVFASPYEVGLLYKGKGVRTWWTNQLHRSANTLPPITHPKIQEAIRINEEMQR